MDKKVYVIIVTYNGVRWIDANIQSLLQSGYPVSIIVVDNKSTDDSVTLLKKYPDVNLILSDKNLGFGKANNAGVQKALAYGADYVFLLNQDAWIFPDTIGNLIAAMEANTGLGIVSPIHYWADGTTQDASFATYYGRKTAEVNGIAIVPFVNAAAWMLSRDCIEKVGYFEPLFGHYGEDRNYCDRVIYHKFLIGIDPGSKIVHDRVITRRFTKDVTQSKYRILATLINPNYSFIEAYMLGLKETLGLPKYFVKFYGWGKALKILASLAGYYIAFVFNPFRIVRARKNAL